MVAMAVRGRRIDAPGHCDPSFQQMEDPAQHGADRQDGRRNRVERKFRNGRVGLVVELRKSQFPERYGGQIQHTGPTRLLFSVDVVHVFVRMARYPVVRFLEHLVPLSETERVRGTGLDAGRYGHLFAVLLVFDLRQRLSIALRAEPAGQRGRRSGYTC